MKKRKFLAMALAILMAVSALPVALPAAATDDAIQPYNIPEIGNQFYVEQVAASGETVLAPDETGTVVTESAAGKTHANWHHAAGVIFRIRPTNEGSWRSQATDTPNPYFYFSLLALAEQKVDTFTSGGQGADHYATFWTSDSFGGAKDNSTNPRVQYENGMTTYYSEDGGLTWKSFTGSGSYFSMSMKDVKAGDVLIYVPFAEFYYYGGFDGTSGANGVTAYNRGYTTFAGGVKALTDSNAAEGTELHSLILSYKKGASGAQVAVTASDLRLVYNVMDETVTSKSGDDYTLTLYAKEPADVTDATVTATVNGVDSTLTGTPLADGRTAYVLGGMTEADVGSVVTFAWSSQSLGVSLSKRDMVQSGKPLQSLPTQVVGQGVSLDTLKGAGAVYLGDSLMYAYRDGGDHDATSGGGWPGRLSETYSMDFLNYSKGGWVLSGYTGNKNGVIWSQLGDKITAQTETERAAVDYVIIDGGINDINRVGRVMGEVSEGFDGYDVGTIAGALEHTIAEARRAYPNAAVGFIILFRMPLAIQGGDALCQDPETMREYVDVCRAVCEKWNVPYLNMYDDADFNTLLQTNSSTSPYLDNNDCLHLNKSGYALTTPYVAAWMASMPKQYVPYDQMFQSVSVSVDSKPALNVYVNDVGAADAKVTASVAGAAPVELVGVKEGGLIKYSCEIEPWQMTEEVFFTWSSVKLDSSYTFATSVGAYADYLLATSGDERVKDTVKAMLHWSAEVQKEKGYKLDALCNAGVDAVAAQTPDRGSVIYVNPDETIWTGYELAIRDGAPVMSLSVKVPNAAITSVVYRVEGRTYATGCYEKAEIADGKVEIPLSVAELGRNVNVRLMDSVGAWKDGLRISGFTCLEKTAESDMKTALKNYAVLSDYLVFVDW